MAVGIPPRANAKGSQQEHVKPLMKCSIFLLQNQTATSPTPLSLDVHHKHHQQGHCNLFALPLIPLHPPGRAPASLSLALVGVFKKLAACLFHFCLYNQSVKTSEFEHD